MKTFDELLAEEEANDAAAKKLTPPSDTSRATTTATTPAQAQAEKKAATPEPPTSGSDMLTAAGYGAARGGTLGMVSRLVGEGTQLGEDWARMNHPELPGLTAQPEAGAQARAEYEKNEEAARAKAPISYMGGEFAGGMVPALAVPVARAAAPVVAPAASASRLAIEGQIAKQAAGKLAASPGANIAAQNFTAGAMNQQSDEPADMAKAGLGNVAAGAVLGKVGEATVGKVLKGSTEREARGLVRDILRNEDTDIAASATTRKRFYEKADSAIQEVRQNKPLESAIRSGDAAGAANIARSTLQVISEPRAGLYKELDSAGMLGIDKIDAELRKAAGKATGAKKTALEAMRGQLETDWIGNRWKNTGALVTRPGKPMAVTGEGVREWLTEAQNQASTVIGGLEEGSRKQVKDALEDVASNVWRGHLDDMAKKVPDVVKNIRAYDRRASGLMAVESVMKQRTAKDAEGMMGFAKKVEPTTNALVASAAMGGIGLGHTGASLAALGSYVALKKAPNAARYMNDNIVSPIQQRALAGVPWAQVATEAAEAGIPANLARMAYDQGSQVARRRSGGSDYSTSTGTR